MTELLCFMINSSFVTEVRIGPAGATLLRLKDRKMQFDRKMYTVMTALRGKRHSRPCIALQAMFE